MSSRRRKLVTNNTPPTIFVSTVLLSLLSTTTRCVVATSSNIVINNDNIEPTKNNDPAECGVYFAPSTIPGAGMGMFAGNKVYEEGDIVTMGDLVVPVSELHWHNGYEKIPFLWDEYVWHYGQFPGMEEEVDYGDLMHVVSFGMGAAVNCMLPLVNVVDAESTFTMSSSGVSSQSPGAGAFTPYHSRMFEATQTIQPGSELFASYGTEYFASRTDVYGYLPLPKNYEQADKLLHEFRALSQNLIAHLEPDDEIINESTLPSTLTDEIWNLVIDQRQVWNESRTLNALPEHHDTIDAILASGGTGKLHYNNSIRDLAYLEEHGSCMDNIKDGISTVPHAGRGAFATRRISMGSVVAPAPLVHIPNRAIFIMYETLPETPEGKLKRDASAPIHKQLLSNYCFAHEESTLLLCPYGLLTALINHSKEHANVKIDWSKTMRHPEWRDMPVEEWGNTTHSGLSFDFVALRDIEEGEEILLDYGDDWDEAFNNHVRNFEPPRATYAPAYDLNARDDLNIHTMDEKSYENEGIHVFCRKTHVESAGIDMEDEYFEDEEFEVRDPDDEPLIPCRVLQRMNDNSYVAAIFSREEEEDEEEEEQMSCSETIDYLLFDLPRDAFFFKDAPYERDHHQTWSFRHEMGIPDSLFPPAWKNIPKD